MKSVSFGCKVKFSFLTTRPSTAKALACLIPIEMASETAIIHKASKVYLAIDPIDFGEAGQIESEHDFARDAGGDDLGREAVVIGPRGLRAEETFPRAEAAEIGWPGARIGGDARRRRVTRLRARERDFRSLRRGRFLGA